MAFVLPKRWPADLRPFSCEFGRSYNDEVHVSPRSRYETVVVRGRPLWTCQMSFQRIHYVDQHHLRQLLEGLGRQNAIEVWDFTVEAPQGSGLATDGAVDEILSPWEHLGSGVLWDDGADGMHWVAGANAMATAEAAAGTLSVAVSGLNTSSLILASGDYVQVGRRLYLCAENLFSDEFGAGTLILQTPLIETAPIGETVRLYRAGCEMRVASAEWVQSRSADDPFISVQVDLVETARNWS